MTERKTLQIRTPSPGDAAPALKKKGRGWEISEKRLDKIHEHARHLRRHATPAHKALAVDRRLRCCGFRHRTFRCLSRSVRMT